VAAPKNFAIHGFFDAARCAPHRAKAQRAAPFGKLGTIGFVLHDYSMRAHHARIDSSKQRLRSAAFTRARFVPT
jgi:hypothetical protein